MVQTMSIWGPVAVGVGVMLLTALFTISVVAALLTNDAKPQQLEIRVAEFPGWVNRGQSETGLERMLEEGVINALLESDWRMSDDDDSFDRLVDALLDVTVAYGEGVSVLRSREAEAD